MSLAPSDHAQGIENWLKSLDQWYCGIEDNSHYLESAYCHFERGDDGNTYLNATVVLQATQTRSEQSADSIVATETQEPDQENRQKATDSVPVTNERPRLLTLLPSRAEAAQGKVVVRQPPKATTPPAQDKPAADSEDKKSPAQTSQTQKETVSNFINETNPRFNIDNNLAGRSFKMTENSALNRDLLELITLGRPPASSERCILIPIVLSSDKLKQEPCLQTDAGRYGIMLRSALLAKVTGSKANLSLYINRLEDIRALFSQAERLKLSRWQAAAVHRSLWKLLNETQLWKLRDESHAAVQVIPKSLKMLPAQLRNMLTDPVPKPLSRKWSDLLWYRWNRTIPAWISDNERKLTLSGHVMAYGAFVSLVWLSLHAALAPDNGIITSLIHQLVIWRSYLMADNATIAIALATAAGLIYALTTKRLTLEERIALSINDKIEAVLDSILADLMKANMDVQIGRLGRSEPPGGIPESVARKLDEVFAMKELVNSYESTVRARRRHVAEEVGKAQRIRAESYQRLRNAALGVTASFVLFEIGSRIQDHRDMLAGTDPYSFSYWMSRRNAGNTTHASVADTGNAPAITAPEAILDCARTEIIEQRPPSPECLDQWRDNALGSSSQLLFLVFLISMLIFFVRVSRRDDGNGS